MLTGIYIMMHAPKPEAINNWFEVAFAKNICPQCAYPAGRMSRIGRMQRGLCSMNLVPYVISQLIQLNALRTSISN